MYENARKILLPATHRSGHHAVGVWLLHQAEGVDDFNIQTIADWWNYLKVKGGLRFFFNNVLKDWPFAPTDIVVSDGGVYVSVGARHWNSGSPGLVPAGVSGETMIKIGDHSHKDIEMFIGTHEQETLKDAVWRADKASLFYKADMILIIRSFHNWVASCLKYSRNMKVRGPIWAEPFSETNIGVYIEHCNHAIKGTVPFILYDEWFASKHYRKEIAESLELHFTDTAINQTSSWGNGSSFDGFDYLKNASEMDVLNRYKKMEDDEEYQQVIQDNEEAIDLSNQLFGKAS